jgi:hypothetical protein
MAGAAIPPAVAAPINRARKFLRLAIMPALS